MDLGFDRPTAVKALWNCDWAEGVLYMWPSEYQKPEVEIMKQETISNLESSLELERLKYFKVNALHFG